MIESDNCLTIRQEFDEPEQVYSAELSQLGEPMPTPSRVPSRQPTLFDFVLEKTEKEAAIQESEPKKKVDGPCSAVRKNENITVIVPSNECGKAENNVLAFPSGLVGDVARWILDSARIPRPKFAIAAALTTCGALIARGVKDYAGQRTNLYTLALAASSGGKDHPMECGMKLVESLGRGRMLAEQVTSDSALEASLENYPIRFMIIDEIGDYFGNIKSTSGSNSYGRTIMPSLKKIWSCSGKTMRGKTRAKDNNGKFHLPVVVENPCLSVYGTGAPSRLFGSLTSCDYDDGSIPRFLGFIEEGNLEARDRPECTVPDELKLKLAEALSVLGWCSKDPTVSWDDMAVDDLPAAKEILHDEEAKNIFREFESYKTSRMDLAESDPVNFMYGKAVENACRIALVIAAFRNPANPVVEKSDAEYSVNLVKNCIESMSKAARLYGGDSKRERNTKKIERLILHAGPNGIERSVLTRHSQELASFERNEILHSLLEAGVIEEASCPGEGKKAITVFRHLDHRQ